VDLGEGDDVLTLEALTGPDALLVFLAEAQFAQVFDEGYKDVFGVVFLEGKVWSGQSRGGRP
jgi:hypothetical protein